MPTVASGSKIKKSARGFTLVELLIVIVIIAVVYALVAVDFRSMFRSDSVRIEKLKEFLLTKYQKFEKIRVECEDEGKRCYVYLDGSAESNATVSLFSYRPTIYAIDYMGELSEVKYPREELCFVYELRRNGSSSQMVVESGGRFTILYAYFKDYEIVESLDEARARLIRKID